MKTPKNVLEIGWPFVDFARPADLFLNNNPMARRYINEFNNPARSRKKHYTMF